MTRTAFTLFVLAQMYRALVALNAGQSAMTMPVPADNVTVAGLSSDVQLVQNQNPDFAIKPMDPRGIVVPTTTIAAPSSTGYPALVGSMYHICPAYPNGGAPANVKC